MESEISNLLRPRLYFLQMLSPTNILLGIAREVDDY